MAYYEVSVLITILATSLIAFYLLYKAKELNLGILISISTGSVIIGFTFGPAFRKMLDYFSESVNINKGLALVISILAIFLIFLLFILIISMVISISIPKKIVSIDCGLIIDNFKSKIRIKENAASLKGEISAFVKQAASNMQKLISDVYNLKNKLKKPVDTTQIIDTMGIEKNDAETADTYVNESDVNSTNADDSGMNVVDAGNVAEHAELEFENNVINDTIDEVVATDENYADAEEISTENEEVAGQPVEELIEEPSEELIAQIAEEPVEEINDEQIEEIAEEPITKEPGEQFEVLAEEPVEEFNTANGELPEALENQLINSSIDESIYIDSELDDEEEDAAEDQQNDAVEFVIEDNAVDEQEGKIDLTDPDSLVLKAFECKDEGKKEEAVEYYLKALECEPDNEMIFWIVLDICTLYKQLGLNELAISILEGLVNDYGSVIKPEIQEEILNNLRQN